MFGEAHGNTFDVRLAELVRQSLEQHTATKPVMVREMANNHALVILHDVLYKNKEPLSSREAKDAVSWVRAEDPARYHKLQALMHAGWDWPKAPVTKLMNFAAWLENGNDIRLIDITMTRGEKLDADEPATADFIRRFKNQDIKSIWDIKAGDIGGIRLRNLWMIDEVKKILAEDAQTAARKTILAQFGFSHLAGRKGGCPYAESLHGLFSAAAGNTAQLIAVFSEHEDVTIRNLLSEDMRQALDTENTVIVRGSRVVENTDSIWSRHSYAEEIDLLGKLSGSDPGIRDQKEYDAFRRQFELAAIDEVHAMVRDYRMHGSPGTKASSYKP
ncbi:MAG: hypothetical protein H6869_09140 [Rhodospirillales bacterium]|nr:hypothetical protein [Rhodospirillales bacterium]